MDRRDLRRFRASTFVASHRRPKAQNRARVTVLTGAAHDGPTPTTESLSAALRMALNPDIRARATALAATIQTDGTEVAARLLMQYVPPVGVEPTLKPF